MHDLDPQKDIPLTPPGGQHINPSFFSNNYAFGWALDGSYVNAAGAVPWYENKETIDLDKASDPRYQQCLETARMLKQQYPGHDAASEFAIAKALVAKIHEQYGNYDSKDGGAYLHHENDKKPPFTYNLLTRANLFADNMHT